MSSGIRTTSRHEGAGARPADRDLIANLEGGLAAQRPATSLLPR